MKKLTILLIGISMVLMSCKKDKDMPAINHFPEDNVWTVKQILDSIPGSGNFAFNKDYHKNVVMKGYVISDEKSGNIYRTIYVRGEDGKCIAFYRPKGDDFVVKVGDHIGFKLYGSELGSYSGLPQVQIQDENFNSLFVIYERGCTDKVKPINTTIERIEAGEHLCDLVKISGVQFDDDEIGKTYAEGTSNTNRTLVTCDGESIIVRTSGYASFAADTLPEGRGTLTSIVSLYNTTWQLLIRNTSDVQLNGNRCGNPGDVMEIPYRQFFTKTFGTYTTYNVLGSQEWVIDHETAKMTGKEGSDIFANEDWLISSPIDMTGDHVKVIIKYLARYFTNFSSEVQLMVSENYEYGENPTNYTWTSIPVEWENVSDWNTFLTTEISLDDYIGKIIVLGVKYVSQTSACGTMEIKSIKVENGIPTPPPAVIFSESFGSSQGDFTIKDVVIDPALSYVWKFSSSYGMVASAYANETSYASDSWLISPAIDMTGFASAKLSFDHAANKLNSGTPSQYYTVLASTDYVEGMPATATWTPLTVPTYPAGNSWTFVASGDVDMNAFANKSNVHIAFRYTSENGNSGSWEVKNVLITE